MALRRWFDFSAVLLLLFQSVESLVTSEIRSEIWLCLSLSFSISLSLYLPSPLFSPHPHLRRDFVISFCMTLDRMMEKGPYWMFHFKQILLDDTSYISTFFSIGFVWLFISWVKFRTALFGNLFLTYVPPKAPSKSTPSLKPEMCSCCWLILYRMSFINAILLIQLKLEFNKITVDKWFTQIRKQ